MNLVERAVRKIKRTIDPPHGFLKGVTSLMHVGANVGQERAIYHRLGLDVLWVEPIPDVFSTLRRNIAGYPRQHAVQALVTERSGQLHRFNIADNDGRSSSILELAEHKTIWPEIGFTGSIELVSSTVDDLAKAVGRSFDALMIDVQGAELLVLRGASETLRGVKVIGAEAADFEIYHGCTTVDELGAFLEPQGFHLARKRLVTPRPGGGACYDLVFRRT